MVIGMMKVKCISATKMFTKMLKMIAGFKIASLIFIFLNLTNMSCQQKPTKTLEESAQVFDQRSVLIDTRNPFLYQSFHIEGSQNLWWEDFLILKNPKLKTRVLDPDLQQTIERLASKGIHPDFTIILINESANAVENKKWKWLLNYLEIKDIELKSLKELTKSSMGQNNRYANAKSQKPWRLLTSDDFQKDLVNKKSRDCFSTWKPKICL